jgi:hypothetical protein
LAGNVTVQAATPVVAVGARGQLDDGENVTAGFEPKLTVPVGVVGVGLVSVTVAVQLSTPDAVVHDSPVVVARETSTNSLSELAVCAPSPL